MLCDGEDNGVDNVEDNGEENEMSDFDYRFWKLEAHIEQNEEFGSFAGLPGAYTDYVFDISVGNGSNDGKWAS